MTLRGRERPPAPWSNVLANPEFGCLITEAGAGYTWAGNAQMNRLTPWSNDPVADPPGEALYLRDEETGEFWSPAPGPCGGDATTVVRHGQGYTRFTRTSHGLDQDLLVFVSAADPVKLVRLRVTNAGDSAQAAVSDLLRRVGAGRAPRAGPTAGAVHARPGERRPLRPKRLGG